MPEFESIRGAGAENATSQNGATGEDLSRTSTRRSMSSRRDGSRPRQLNRIISAQHLDDSSSYHYNHHHDHSDDEDEDTQDDEEKRVGLDRESSADTAKDGDDGAGKASTESDTRPNFRDIEKGPLEPRDPTLKKSKSRASSKSRDPNLVTWDGPDDPENPKNWSSTRKFFAVIVVASFTFISPVSSSMVAPSTEAIARDLNITNEVVQQMVLSVFVLAYAIGPLFLGPLSEIYGRVPVLQISNLFYLIFDAACGGARTKGQLIAFRFLSGLGGSAPLAVGGGVLSDIFNPEQRGKAVAIYSLMPLLGPAIGPIAGGFITLNTTWRWSFYATAIADAVIQVVGFFFLYETWAPALLKRKAKKLRKETGNDKLHTQWESPDRTLGQVLRRSLVRPFKMITTQPIVQFLAVYMAYLYGLMYLVLSIFPSIFQNTYHENVGIAGLNYISLGVGFFLGSQISARLNDRIYKRLKAKNNGEGRPEYRCIVMMPASLLVPTGLFIFGWTAQYGVHWIGPNIGAAIFAAGVIVSFQCIQTYLIDAYVHFAASAIASATVLRSLAGFGFPLFAPYMYNALGVGWGTSLLGFIGLGLGIPAPIFLWFFGQRLRMKSQFAAGS